MSYAAAINAGIASTDRGSIRNETDNLVFALTLSAGYSLPMNGTLTPGTTLMIDLSETFSSVIAIFLRNLATGTGLPINVGTVTAPIPQFGTVTPLGPAGMLMKVTPIDPIIVTATTACHLAITNPSVVTSVDYALLVVGTHI